MSLKVFGRAGFEAALNRGFELAEAAEAVLRENPGWQVVTPAYLRTNSGYELTKVQFQAFCLT